MNYKPIGPRVLIKKQKEEKKSSIILSDEGSATYSTIGIVSEIGTGIITPDGRMIPFSLKKGDKVLLPKYILEECIEGDEDYLIIDEREVLSIITD